MKGMLWALAIACVVVVVWSALRARRRMEERRHDEAARAASFLAQAIARPAAIPVAPEERLLLDAAAKAGEAGEPALAIQLYARLVARFPQGALAAQARSAVEAQKKKLATARAPDTAGPG
jgi:hypothetical protein